MREIVTKEAFMQVTHLDRSRFGSAAAGPLMRLAGINRFNRSYHYIHNLQGSEFIDAFLRTMKIDVVVEGKGLNRIPKEGAFLTVSNHPYGMWDGLILLKLLQDRRPDFKVLANFLLQQIPQLQGSMLAVNPFTDGPEALSKNIRGMKEVFRHLEAGQPLGLFPAGEVSSFHRRDRAVTDRAWQKQSLKFIRKAEVPVVPIFFEGGNSALFQVMGMIHPLLRNAALPTETLRERKTRITVRIGSPITVREQRKIGNVDRLGRYLRSRVYALGSGIEVQTFFRRPFSFPQEQDPVAAAQDPGRIQAEVDALQRAGAVIASQGEFDVVVARAVQIPAGLQEIGRLRELTFREVGEGTGHARDLDEYDLYYYHLFLWDREAGQIAGAYRMGPGDEIMMKYGKRGFYTFSLFRMQKGFTPVLSQSVELGRSFILPDYQRKRLPLFLLWKGIRRFLLQHPQYRYLIGPVSISNDYSSAAKQFMVAFIEHYFFDHQLARHIKPRKQFKPIFPNLDVDGLLEGTADDIKMADRIVEELEPSHARLPVLLKKYIKQNARIIGFNVDPKFMNALDGFMVLDIQSLPPETDEIYG